MVEVLTYADVWLTCRYSSPPAHLPQSPSSVPAVAQGFAQGAPALAVTPPEQTTHTPPENTSKSTNDELTRTNVHEEVEDHEKEERSLERSPSPPRTFIKVHPHGLHDPTSLREFRAACDKHSAAHLVYCLLALLVQKHKN
jgi:hypothetical protein